MSIRIVVALMIVAPSMAFAQAIPRVVDSSGLGLAIAAALAAGSGRDSGWSGVIDTSASRWNLYVRRGLLVSAPTRLPQLTDSVAYYASHFSVKSVATSGDTAVVSVRWSLCYDRDSWAFGEEQWLFLPSAIDWKRVYRSRDPVTTGHGICQPFKRSGAR